MSISFNQVPTTGRVPFLYAEFNSSNASQGASLKVYHALMMGQMLAAGTALPNVPIVVTSEAQALTLFGQGSMLHSMVRKYFKNNQVNELTVLPQSDNGAGVAAVGTLTVTGPATASGTLALYIAGKIVSVAVTSGDSANTIAAAISAAINLVLYLPVTAGVASAVVTLTARHKGLLGNGIDVRLNYYSSDVTPAGVGVTIVAMGVTTAGTTAPSLSTSIANMTEKQFDVIIFPYTDSASLVAIEAELDDRWGPIRQNDGHVFTAKDDTVSNLGTFGTGRNSKHVTCFGTYKYPNPNYEVAAACGAVACQYLEQDPARPLQTLTVVDLLAPAPINDFKMSERNILLHDGIATLKIASDSSVQLERAITMYQLNSAGAVDVAYLDVNTLMTLSYIRWDFRNYMLTKYARYKLGNDGKLYGPGQAIMTPKLGRTEAINRFRIWEELGLVENGDQFKRDLIVERNAGDTNRLDFMLPPDLMNQLMIMGVQIGFIL